MDSEFAFPAHEVATARNESSGAAYANILGQREKLDRGGDGEPSQVRSGGLGEAVRRVLKKKPARLLKKTMTLEADSTETSWPWRLGLRVMKHVEHRTDLRKLAVHIGHRDL